MFAFCSARCGLKCNGNSSSKPVFVDARKLQKRVILFTLRLNLQCDSVVDLGPPGKGLSLKTNDAIVNTSNTLYVLSGV